MGWLSTLADVGLGIAAPFTGGLSLAGIPLANKAIASLQGNGSSDGIPNIPVTSGLPGGTAPTSSASSPYGNIIGNLMSPQGLGALGKGLGGVAQADASNRGTKIATTLAANNQQMQEQAQRAADLATLPKQIVGANWLAGGGQHLTPNYSSNGRLIPHFDLGTPQITPADQAAGSSLSDQLTKRLNTAPTYADPTQYMNPSATENALNWASPILAATGATADPTTTLIQQLMKGINPSQGTPPQQGATGPAQVPPLSIPQLLAPVPQLPTNVTGLGLPDSDNGSGY